MARRDQDTHRKPLCSIRVLARVKHAASHVVHASEVVVVDFDSRHVIVERSQISLFLRRTTFSLDRVPFSKPVLCVLKDVRYNLLRLSAHHLDCHTQVSLKIGFRLYDFAVDLFLGYQDARDGLLVSVILLTAP